MDAGGGAHLYGDG